MPLEPPVLDTRTFDQLYREARLRATRYTPEWTDFNESDPGTTLLQLFCWLTEMTLHELNRVPLRNYVKFLQLLGMELEPARPAQAHLTFTPAAEGDVGTVPRRARVQADVPGDQPPPVFETEAELDLIPYPLTDVRVADGSGAQARAVANVPGQPFRPLGWQPQPGSALYLGFDPERGPANPVFPPRLAFRIFLPEASASAEVAPAQSPVQLFWEYRPGAAGTRWRRLNFEDGTAGFTRDGYMHVEGPRALQPSVDFGVADARYWLRCRLVGGSYSVGREPEVEFLRPNTAPAESLSTIENELVGRSQGRAGEVFRLRFTPVRARDLELLVRGEGEDEPDEPWKRTDDFFASKPTDRHYLLNPTTGEIRFGDGRRGRLPVAGAEIVARRYRYGGGDAANVQAGTITTLLTGVGGVESVTNERPAVGGRDEETQAELEERAPAELRRGRRAVTVNDFAALAGSAGGIARATALGNHHPDYPEVSVPGAITVVVVPDTEEVPPTPSPDQIEAVERYLEDFRLLTTELHVRGPRFLPVSVEALVAIRPYASEATVQRKVAEALDRVLSPLPLHDGTADDTEDRSGGGRAFGLDLYPTSLLAVALAVDDVVAVPKMTVTVDGRPYNLDERIEVPPDGLLYGAGHVIVAVPYSEEAA